MTLYSMGTSKHLNAQVIKCKSLSVPMNTSLIRKFNAIISDIRMPGTDGLALLKQIKQRDWLPKS